ncbi:MAG: glycosyl transferase [Ignavibacteria bacterium]|nr:glycosyl transferase [Ignavibacteria bacterium]
MASIEFIFWFFQAIIFYTYIGYACLLYVLVRLKRLFKRKEIQEINHRVNPEMQENNLRVNPKVEDSLFREIYEPEVTLLIAAYNEKDYLQQKVQNSLSLDYPPEKLHQLWISDGSDDGTPEALTQFPGIRVLHQHERKGKIAAINRGMQHVETPIVIFSDANTFLGVQSVRKIVELFTEPATGCVSGEKRIFNSENEAATGAGEGLYWRYESTLKKWDAELNSVVGAAGELFAIRTELYQEVEPDTLLDDFIISLRIAMKGYSIQYDPDAYAIETASADVKEELKRKIRIAAGGIQSIIRLWQLLNIFKYGILSFQYISHRVLRWTLAPLALPIVFGLNIFLINEAGIYYYLLILQALFYLAAFLGWSFQKFRIKFKVFFVPYYFVVMNYAVYRGFLRFIKNSQSVNWERARRG